MNEVYFVDGFISVEYNSIEKWVVSRWKGYLNIAQIQLGCEKQLELAVKKSSTKRIIDFSQAQGTWTFANEWLANSYMPRAIKAGMTIAAYIYSKDIFSQYTMNQLFKKTNEYSHHIFMNVDEAEAWLKIQ